MFYFIASPIGNLKDISFRAIEILEQIDAIYAEDTRVSKKLTEKYNIKKPIFKLNEHSSQNDISKIITRLSKGDNLAYLSDAGMPCISDPGKNIVKELIVCGEPYTVIPGASAAVTAFAAASSMEKRYIYLGFLNRKKRKKELQLYSSLSLPLVIYESPKRVKALLKDAYDVLGECDVTIAREISKIYEEFIHTSLQKLASDDFESIYEKGEFVIVIDKKSETAKLMTIDEIQEEILTLKKQGLKNTEIAKILSKKQSKFTRQEIYDKIHNMI